MKPFYVIINPHAWNVEELYLAAQKAAEDLKIKSEVITSGGRNEVRYYTLNPIKQWKFSCRMVKYQSSLNTNFRWTYTLSEKQINDAYSNLNKSFVR